MNRRGEGQYPDLGSTLWRSTAGLQQGPSRVGDGKGLKVKHLFFAGQGVLPPRRGCVATEGVLPPVFPRAEGKGSRATHQGGGGGPRLVMIPFL